MPNSHVFDRGTVLLSTVYDGGNIVNLSSCSVLQFAFQKPDGTYYSASGVLYTDGSDGRLMYIFASGELNLGGTWSFQNYIVNPSGAWSTDQHSFKVSKNLNIV